MRKFLQVTGDEGSTLAERDAEQLAKVMADIARVLFSPGTVDQVLHRIVTASVLTIDGCDEAGLCARAQGDPVPMAASPLAEELDRQQLVLGEGPCIDALGGANSTYVSDLSETTMWPRFAKVAAEAGLRSVLAFRLFTEAETIGALQLYARLPLAFNPTDRAQGLIFAAHASQALAVAQTNASGQARIDHLQAALESREVIGQAQGILMERERITADQAFALLRKSSQRLNVKLRDVAQQLVDTGAFPD